MQSKQLTAAPQLRPGLLLTFAGLSLLTILGWYLTEAIPQNTAYHLFADQRSLLGIPHALNVISNLGFFLIGLAGIFTVAGSAAGARGCSAMYLAFYTAIVVTGFGSAYYHLDPNNLTLVWDRLPMAVGFMSILAVVVVEHLDPRLGRGLFPWLLALGVGSVLYWHWQDDLRPYALVQFGSLLAMAAILLLKPRPGSRLLWLALACYLLAKIFETYDTQIYALCAHWVSGHSLKHLAASIAPLFILLRHWSTTPAPKSRGNNSGNHHGGAQT